MAQDTGNMTDNFSRASDTMRNKVHSLNKDMDELLEKIKSIRTTKVNVAIDTTKAMDKMQKLITMRAELNSMNKTRLTVNVDAKNTMNELKAMEKKFKDYNKAIADIERNIKSLNDKLKETASLSQSAEKSVSNLGTSVNKSNNKSSDGLGDSLKDAVVEKGVDLVLGTVSNASSTFLSSVFGSKGGAYSNALSMGINGAEIGAGMAGPVGAVLGGVIGAGLELINGTLENYAAEDEKFKSYVQDQYGKIIQNRSDEIASASKLAAGQEDAGDPNSFTAKTKAVEDAKNRESLKMGSSYNLERKNGKGGLNDQLAFNATNGAELQQLNGIVGDYEAGIENKKNQYLMDAQRTLLNGVKSGNFTSDEQKELNKYHQQYEKARKIYYDDDSTEDQKMSAASKMKVAFESTNVLAENAYGGSSTAQIEQKANEVLITNLQESAAKSDLGWKAVSHIEAMLSEGRLSVAPAVKHPSPAAYRFGYDPRTIAKGESGKSSAYGLSYVPYNNFPALLHEGERVLTASENRGYKSGTGVTVTGNSFTIREEADITKVAKALHREIEKARMVMAV